MWLIRLHVVNDHMDICDIEYVSGNESKGASKLVCIDPSPLIDIFDNGLFCIQISHIIHSIV